tara:strand:- start:902 stop:2158 length:1257 start_codon:yes stop_codon:yes gene_type:complete
MHTKIAIIGLGYVGIPLAVEFGKKYRTIGYDKNIDRVNELSKGLDKTKEVTKSNLQSSTKLSVTSNLKDIASCNFFIIAVPTPIDKNNNPDLSILLNATSSIAPFLKKNDIVIYESTVYPGCTEDDCVPILERESGLKYNKDFFCGYSPERINPGDKNKTLTKIVKITSGSNPSVAEKVDILYKSIITAGTFKANSIKVAEAAKVIENCQRDINIAFVNELSIIFNKMNLDTQEVLDAAETKWNFLPFKPGLVGGHCIGVDPYYLTYKAKTLGYKSKIIDSGRELNDSIPKYICKEIDNKLVKNKITKFNLLFLGVTFKENCPDIRNSKVFNMINFFKSNQHTIDVCDPHALDKEVYKNKNIKLIDLNEIKSKYYDCIIISVAHKEFLDVNLEEYIKNKDSLIYDLKGIYKNKNYRRL